MAIYIYFLHKHTVMFSSHQVSFKVPSQQQYLDAFEEDNAQTPNSQSLKLTIKSTDIINGAVRPPVVLNRGLTFWELNDCVQ